MEPKDKLRMFTALIFGSEQKALADAIGVSAPTVGAWLQGSDIRSSSLARLYRLGLNITWLLDDEDKDMRHMFAANRAGQHLAYMHLGITMHLTVTNDRPAKDVGKGEKISLKSEKTGKTRSKGGGTMNVKKSELKG